MRDQWSYFIKGVDKDYKWTIVWQDSVLHILYILPYLDINSKVNKVIHKTPYSLEIILIGFCFN